MCGVERHPVGQSAATDGLRARGEDPLGTVGSQPLRISGLNRTPPCEICTGLSSTNCEVLRTGEDA